MGEERTKGLNNDIDGDAPLWRRLHDDDGPLPLSPPPRLLDNEIKIIHETPLY